VARAWRIGLVIGLAVGVAGVAAWARAGHERNQRYSSRFGLIVRGTPRSKVIDIMGRPSREDACRPDLVPGVPPGCADEIVYSDAFAPLDPQYWVVRLDRRGTVIENTWTASP
jgi:hypothetical protein